MATPFSNKCTILGQYYVTFFETERETDFFKFNDIGLPLAYYIFNGLVDIDGISDKAKGYIEETWSMIEEAVQLDKDIEYSSLDEVIQYGVSKGLIEPE